MIPQVTISYISLISTQKGCSCAQGGLIEDVERQNILRLHYIIDCWGSVEKLLSSTAILTPSIITNAENKGQTVKPDHATVDVMWRVSWQDWHSAVAVIKYKVIAINLLKIYLCVSKITTQVEHPRGWDETRCSQHGRKIFRYCTTAASQHGPTYLRDICSILLMNPRFD